MESITETVEGYVVDIACLRKYAVAEMAERASVHTRECALMGHCVESGFALVEDDGRVMLLDSEATPSLVRILTSSSRQQGVKLRAVRKREGEEMKTVALEEIF